MRAMLVPVLLSLALSTAACGGDDSDGDGARSPDSAESANEAAVEQAEAEAVTEEEVTYELVRRLGAKEDEYGVGLEYTPAGANDPCSIILILTTSDEVATYRGDPPDPDQPVVTNPAGTVGVKVSATTADSAACLRAAEDALKGL